MRLLLLLSAVLFTLGLFSCKRCLTCQELGSGDTGLVKYPETCGSSNAMYDYVDRLEANKAPQNVIKCTEKSKLPF
jgi:hypothetical protein